MNRGGCRDKLRPLGSDGRVAAIVAGAAAVGTELVIGGDWRRLGWLSPHPRHGMMGGGGSSVTVHAGRNGVRLCQRLANAVLSYRLGRGEGGGGERRQEEH